VRASLQTNPLVCRESLASLPTTKEGSLDGIIPRHMRRSDATSAVYQCDVLDTRRVDIYSRSDEYVKPDVDDMDVVNSTEGGVRNGVRRRRRQQGKFRSTRVCIISLVSVKMHKHSASPPALPNRQTDGSITPGRPTPKGL
jgi:hypothetical protein